MNSGATIGIADHFSLTVVTARAGAFGAFSHSSGARVAVSPAKASVPDDARAKADGLTSTPSIVVVLPSRPTIAMALLNPRATLTASDRLSIQRGCDTGRSMDAAVRFCGAPPAIGCR